MANFDHSTARIAAWNLAGYWGLPAERLAYQVEGLALLDAEVIALVEINPASALESLKQGLADKGVVYESSIFSTASHQPDLQHGVHSRQPQGFSHALEHGHGPGQVSGESLRSPALCGFVQNRPQP